MIIGKLYGGHFSFMQIRPLMKKGFCPPSKNTTKCIIRRTCAKFCEFIPGVYTTESMDYYHRLTICG